jgi:hypothetical protein
MKYWSGLKWLAKPIRGDWVDVGGLLFGSVNSLTSNVGCRLGKKRLAAPESFASRARACGVSMPLSIVKCAAEKGAQFDATLEMARPAEWD